MTAKISRSRSEPYLKHIRSLACLICQYPGCVAHHIMHAEPSAMSLKSGDRWAVPLCTEHHGQLHGQGDERVFWALYGVDAEGWATREYERWVRRRSSTNARQERSGARS